MKHTIWLIPAILFACHTPSNSMPAFPKRIFLQGSDGNTVALSLQGDEHCKYAVEESSGFTAVQDSMDCWRYLTLGKSGYPEISNIKVAGTKIEELPSLLGNTPGRLIPYQPQSTGPDKERHEVSRAGTDNNTVIGKRKALIILAEFPDRRFHCQPQEFEELFNMKDYTLNNATGSVADYFNEVSEGQLDLTSTIIGPFTSKRNMSYYGKNSSIGGGDSNPMELFLEALDYARSSVDLKEFDCNYDGLIDNIHIIYAGYGEEAGASANAIWAHECTFSPIDAIPGLKIDRYSCSPELRNNQGNTITTIGPPCHEICHALGAMDFYDTDYSQRGEYQGTSTWDIMAAGSWNNGGATPAWPNPYVRAYNFGWAKPEVLTNDGVYDFKDSKRKIYRIDTFEDNDYFLLEYRDGQRFSSSEPGTGMMIFHIGPDIERYARTNSINATFPQQCYPVCASSNYTMPTSNSSSYGNIDSPSCAFSDRNGSSVFDKNSIPGALSFSGKESGFAVSDIHEETDNITFSFSCLSDTEGNRDGHILWSESFNSDDALTLWEQTEIAGHSVWNRYSNFGNSSIKGYLSLSAKSGTLNPREIKTRLISPEIILSKSSMIQHDSTDTQLPDIIFTAKIRNLSKSTAFWKFFFADGDEVISEFVLGLENGKDWVQLTEKLPLDYESIDSLRLIIETTMESSTESSLELSDINFLLQESTTDIPYITEDLPTDMTRRIFNISGRMIHPSDIDRLPKGIYIMLTPEGVKKTLSGK